MPKIYCFILFMALFSGCTQLQYIDINLKTPGIASGVLIIRNDTGGTAYSENIKNHSVKLTHRVIEQSGYYTLNISNSDKTMMDLKFDVYLEPGQYDIELNSADPAMYPDIKSPSATQQELSAYYTMAAKLKGDRQKQYRQANARMNSKESALLPKDAFNKLLQTENDTREKLSNVEKEALAQFVKQYPKNITGAHIMAGMPYESDPVFYYGIFQQLPVSVQKTYDGQVVGDKLSALVKLALGHKAPDISGVDPDGKSFDPKTLKGKKIYLVELWKSANQQSREQHAPASIENLMHAINDKNQFGMISISLDHKMDWWLSAITDDHMTWPQYSDMKGNESINVTNWGITHLPTYYLVDSNWSIVDKDLIWQEIPVAVNQYLQHH